MIEKTKRRLGVAEESVNPQQEASDFPDPLEALTAEERAIVRPYMEAQIMGWDRNYPETEGLQPAMYKYLKAWADTMLAARVPMLSRAEILRYRKPAETELAALAARFDAIEKTQATE